MVNLSASGRRRPQNDEVSAAAVTVRTAAPGRFAAWTVTIVGVTAAVVLAGQVLRLGVPEAAAAAVLPLAWLVAGTVALRARPDHVGALLMSLVGTSHLAAFALVLPLAQQAGPTGTAAWATNLVGSLLFAGGFAALAVLLASYPHGTAASRGFARVAFATAVLVPVVDALTHERSPLVVTGQVEEVAAPEPLVLVDLPFELFPLVPLLVVVGVVLLVRRGRRAEGIERRRLSWALGAGGLLGLLLLATPAATVLLPVVVWSAIFVTVAAAVPFVLLAGLARYRLMDVDLYVGRTLAQGAVVVLVVSAYAAAASWVGLASPAAVLVVVLAALTGGALRARLETLVDRWLTGGRIRGQALVRHLAETLESVPPGQAAQRTVATIASGLDVSWVRMVLDGRVVAEVGEPTGPAACAVPLTGAGETIGDLECGPRHGGWSEPEVAQVRLLARHSALAVHGDALTRELATQVEALRSSRRRLVHAEQSVRRRLERDLHDGVQQQLVALLSRLGALELLVDPATPAADVTRLARAQAEASLTELRELIRGIHPPVLADRGLVAAVRARADLLPIPVSVTAQRPQQRYAPELEAAAYYVVSEALTNVLKHSGADRAVVEVGEAPGGLVVTVSDDGRGLADDADGGSGLAGLRDRVEALGGSVGVGPGTSGGTTVRAVLPTEGAR